MRRALIIGGRGQSGRAIGRRLAEEGWEVTATTGEPVQGPAGPARGPADPVQGPADPAPHLADPAPHLADPAPHPADPAPHPAGVRWVRFLRDDPAADLTSVVPRDTDVVVDITAFTPAHGRQLLALGDRIGAAIVMSTLSVYSDAAGRSLDGSNVGGEFPDWPVPIPEDWVTVEPADDSYSSRKVALERLLRAEAPWPVTIVRPGAIHGPHSHHLREWYFIKRALDHRRRVILPYNGTSVFQPTAAANLAGLVARAAERRSDLTLNCGDLDPPSAAQISATIEALTGWETERVLLDGPPPSPTVGDHPWAVPRRVVAGMRVAIDELGYRQPATYSEAVAESVAWALDACNGHDWRDVFPTLTNYPDLFDYAAEDAFLAGRGSRGT